MCWLVGAGLVGFLALLLVAAAAGAAVYPVSGSPYAVAPVCQSQGLDGEVSLAVDRRSGRMVAAWIQDVEGLGSPVLGTDEVVTASSGDGVSWTRGTAPPGVMVCDTMPGPNDDVVDPSVSVGPDGRWYLARMGEQALPTSILAAGVYVSTSRDGIHWSSVARPILDNSADDFDTVVADPTRAGRAYVTATNYPTGTTMAAPPQSDRIELSKTTDGGASFTPPATVHQSRTGFDDGLSRLVVLRDGSLLDVYIETPASTLTSGRGSYTLYATRSRDHGTTWSSPVAIGSGAFRDLVDPKTKTVYARPCCAASLSAGANDTAELAWTTNSSTISGDVHIGNSLDGGKTWSITDLGRPAQAFEAAIASTPGTIAVTWYDFSGAQPAGQARPTTLWLARSSDGGATWSIDAFAGPFDLATAAPVGAGYLGDYQSLVAVNGGFEAAFTLAKPQAQHPTDIFATAIR